MALGVLREDARPRCEVGRVREGLEDGAVVQFGERDVAGGDGLERAVVQPWVSGGRIGFG